MLQRAAGNAYSWWAASHIRTKQSKWLDNDLEEMEDRVKSMLKIIEEDGDSFAKKAEMYFKKRPELVHFVEETYKAYRALAEKYDHISGELHKANHTIATAFPDQVQFDMQDEEDDNLLKVNTPTDSSKMRKPSAEIPQISLMNKKKENQPALKKSRLARVTSQSNKDMAQVEIDRLQKGILVLQTEKEFIKSSYESGIAKYWEIEKQITEMQEEVFLLQDEFSASVVIEDDEARALMAVTALKSCEDTLVNLQEQQKRSIEEARIESERIKIAKEKLKACKGESAQSETTEISDESREMSFTTVNMEEEVSSQKQSLESQSICVEVKEHVEISSDSSVVELAEKINELVTKVISLELTASSQTAQIKSLRLEADVLHKHLQSFEEEKKTLIDDSNSLRDRLKQAEEKLQRTQDLEECARDEKSMSDKNSTEARLSVGDISEELMSPKHHDQVNIAGPSQEEVTSLHNIESARDSEEKEVKEILELEDCFQDEKSMIDKNSAEACLSPVDISEKVMSPKHQDQVNIAVPSQEEVTFLHNIEAPRDCENREVKEILDTVDNLVEEEQVNIAGPSQALHNIEAPRDTEKKEVKEILDTVNNLVEEESQGIEELGRCLKDQKVFDHSETGSLLEDGSIKFQDPKQEVEIRTSQAGVSIHPSKEPRIQLGEQEVSLNWLHSLVDGLEGKEKILLAEYTSILRNYKEAKKRLSEVEKKNQEYLFETTTQLRELKSANAMKDEKIQSLLQNIRFLQSNSYKNADIRLQEIERSSNLQKPNISEDLNLEAIAKKDASFEISDGSPIGDEDIKLSGTDGQHATSAVEEKFRRDIDTLLEENLEFWLRFSTSFHNIQKFQTAFEDLQAEIEKLNDSKLEEGSSHSAAQEGMNLESPPIDRRLRELKTELEVWLEQNVLLQGELQSRFSSLCSIQEEISGALEASLEGDGVQFAPYQAAKFQGELLNMQLENNKVADELQAGLDHVSGLQAEVEKTMSKLHEKFEPSGSKASHHNHFRHFSTRSKVPLRSFLFGAKPKKKPSIFACVNPALQKQFGDMATRRPT